jgi:hypothetical protein
MKITNGKDFWAGVMFMAFGLGFAIVAQDYAMGNAVRMGPAYFPTMLGGLLTILGAIIFFRSFVSKVHHSLRVFPFRPAIFVAGLVLSVIALYSQGMRDAGTVAQIAHMAFSGVAIGMLFAAFGPTSLWMVLAAVVVFGYMLKPLGMVVATGLLIYGSAWGGHEFKFKEVTIMFVVLVVLSVLGFVHGLGLPMEVWPSFWE